MGFVGPVGPVGGLVVLDAESFAPAGTFIVVVAGWFGPVVFCVGFVGPVGGLVVVLDAGSVGPVGGLVVVLDARSVGPVGGLVVVVGFYFRIEDMIFYLVVLSY